MKDDPFLDLFPPVTASIKDPFLDPFPATSPSTPPLIKDPFAHLDPRAMSPNEEQKIVAATIPPPTSVMDIASGAIERGRHQTARGLLTSRYMLGMSDDVDGLAYHLSQSKMIEEKYPKSMGQIEGEAAIAAIPGKGWGSFVPTAKEFISRPELALPTILESIPSGIPSMAGAGAGAIAGSLVGPIGTAGGALAGMAAGSGVGDYGASFEGYLKDKFKPENVHEWKAILSNKDAINEAHWMAAKHSISVATFDLIGAKGGGAFAARFFTPNSGIGKKTIGAVGGVGIDAVSEGFGEGVGTYLATGEVDVKGATVEALSGAGMSIGTVGLSAMSEIAKRKENAPIVPPSDSTLQQVTAPLDTGATAEKVAAAAPLGGAPSIVGKGKPFYSALEKTVTDKGMTVADGGQWQGWLRNQPRIKREEIEETGIDSLFNSGERVTKQDVLTFLEERRVDVREVVKENAPHGLPAWDEAGRKETQYAEYQTPGPSANYRELLLTVPAEDSDTVKNLRAADFTEEQIAGMVVGDRYKGEVYDSPHWIEPNVISHVRFADRQDNEGRTLLHLEEIQADAHQKGRKVGYKAPVNPQLEAEAAIIENKLVTAYEERMNGSKKTTAPAGTSFRAVPTLEPKWIDYARHPNRNLITEEEAIIARQYHKALTAELEGVPNLPFKTNWPELSFKRMLRWAADNGYQRISWTTGDEQVRRYGNDPSITQGMREFYDKIIPSIARKYAKRMGGFVGTTYIETGRDETSRVEQQVHYMDIPPTAISGIKEGLPLFSRAIDAPSRISIRAIDNKTPLPENTEKIGKIIEDLAKRFGISGRGTIIFDNNLKLDNQFIFGLAQGYTDGSWTISLNPSMANSLTKLYAIAMHEFGHILMFRKYAQAPDSTKAAIRAAYQKFISETPNNTTLDELLLKRDNAIANMYKLKGESDAPLHSLEPDQRKYWAGFDEWFAEQVARWGTSDVKPLTVVERFLSNLGLTMAKMFRAFSDRTNINQSADKAMSDWLNSYLESGPTLAPIALDLDARTKQTNQALLDKVTPEQEATEQQDETRLPRNAINKLFDGNPPSEVREMAARADRFNKFYKWMLSLIQMAKRNPHIAELQLYREDMQNMHLEQQKIMDGALQVLKRWKALGKEGERIGAFIDDINNMVYRTPEEVKNGVSRHPTPDELRLLARKHNISENGLRVYGNIRSMFDGFLEIIRKVRLADAMKIADPVARDAAVLATNTHIERMRRRPYFPAMRFGHHTITIRDAAGKVLHFETVERRGLKSAERVQKEAEKELKKRLTNGQTIHLGVMAEDARGMIGMPPQLLEMMAQRLDLSTTQRDALEQLRFELAPGSSFKHRFQHKRQIEGASQDYKRAFANYFFFGANFYGKAKYANLLREHIKSVRDQAKFMPDAIKRGQIANFMADHFAEAMNPKEDFLGGKLRGIMFLWALGFSPAAATLNLTQMLVGTYPFLANKFGDAATIAAMGRAGTQMTTYYKRGTYEGMTDFHLRAISEGIKDGIITEAMAPELATMTDGNNLKQGWGGNVAQQGFMWMMEKSAVMFELTEQMNRRITFRAALDLAEKQPNSKHVNEVIAANQRQYQKLLDEGWPENEARAFTVAKDAVETTQYVYARWAQPRFMRGKLRTVFVFKTFLQNTLFMLWNNPGAAGRSLLITAFIGGLMGLPGGDDLKEILKAIAYQLYGKEFDLEREARKYIIEVANGKIPPDILLHGMARRGFGMSTVADGMGWLVGKTTGEDMFQKAMTGNPGKTNVPFPIFDRSRAVSLGNILPIEVGKLFGPPTKNDSRVIADQVQKASGAAFGTFFNIYKAMSSDLEASDPKRWERAVPRFMGSIMKGSRELVEGKERNRAGATVVQFDPRDPEQLMEAIGTMGGYNNFRVQKQWDRIMAEREVVEFYNIRKQGLLKQYDAARRGKDEGELNDVRSAIKRFNNDLPKEAKDKAISGETIIRSMEGRARSREAQESGVPVTKQDRALVKGIQGLFPESVIDVRRVR